MSAFVIRTRLGERHPLWLLGAAVVGFFTVYHLLLPFWDRLLYTVFALPRDRRWADALHFFLYDTTILLLLVGIIFVARVLRSFLSIERTRALLGGKREGVANVAAAGLGVATPFCSCSAVSAFIGFEIAALYLATGLLIAIFAGAVLGRLRLERYIEPFVLEAAANVGTAVPFAVLVGVPLYSNAAGILPMIAALHAKGLAMGTLLAFMVSVVALSLPEMILLRRVLRPQLLACFIAVVATGIVATGFLFNAIL